MRRAVPLALVFLACGGGHAPWPKPAGAPPAAAGEVRTLNAGYRRTTSQVLVRQIDRPTRANLDFAAYHANFMNADPEPEGEPAAPGRARARRPFAGAV